MENILEHVENSSMYKPGMSRHRLDIPGIN